MNRNLTHVTLATALGLAALIVPPANAADPDGEKAEKHALRIAVSESSKGERTPYLGLMLREETRSPEGGARVAKVIADSPAEKGGLREGDVVVGFGDAVIRGPVSLTKRIRESNVGDKVLVTVLRDGKKVTVTVEIGERRERRVVVEMPGGEEEDILLPDLEKLDLEKRDLSEHMEELQKNLKELHVAPRALGRSGWSVMRAFERPRLGVEMVETTPDLRAFLGGRREAGVLVGRILAGTPAEKAGVRVGDLIVSVDGEPVEDSSDLIEALSDKEGKTLDLELVRDRKTMHLKVAIPEAEKNESGGPLARRAVRPATCAASPRAVDNYLRLGEFSRALRSRLRCGVLRGAGDLGGPGSAA